MEIYEVKDPDEILLVMIALLASFHFEKVMKATVLCQLYFINECVKPEKKFAYTKKIAKTLIDSYENFMEEMNHGTSQANH